MFRTPDIARFAWLALTPLLVGCSDESAAKEAFSIEFTCPAERVAAVERKDVSSLEVQGLSSRPPPPEVSADPGRLTQWNAQQQKDADFLNRPVFEVSGCGHDEFYTCAHFSRGHSVCQHGKAPASAAKPSPAK